MNLDEATLEILSCDLSVRPRDAASVEDVLQYMRTLKVDGNIVFVQFDEAGKDAVESFVNAERLCCTGLTWELTTGAGALQLAITGTLEQVPLIKNWFEDKR